MWCFKGGDPTSKKPKSALKNVAQRTLGTADEAAVVVVSPATKGVRFLGQQAGPTSGGPDRLSRTSPTPTATHSVLQSDSPTASQTNGQSVQAQPAADVGITGAAGSRAQPEVKPEADTGLLAHIGNLQSEVARLTARDTMLMAEVSALQQRASMLQDAKDAACESSQDARNEVLALEAQVQDLQSSLTTLKQAQQAAATEAVQQAAAAHVALQDSQARCSALEAQVAQITTDHERLLAKERSARAQAEAQAHTAAQELAGMQATHSALLSDLAALQAHLVAANAAALAAQQQASQAQARVTVAEAAAAEANEEADQLREEIELHNSTAELTAQQVDQLLLDHARLRDKHLALVQDMQHKDQLMELLQHQLAECAELDLDGLIKAAVNRVPHTITDGTLHTSRNVVTVLAEAASA